MYRRTGLSTMLVALAIVCSITLQSFAEVVLVRVEDSKNATFLITVKDGVVTVNPIKRVITAGTITTQPPDNPDNPNPPTTEPNKELIAQIKTETQTVLTAGGSKTSGAAIASVYSLVSDKVSKGEIALDKWPAALSQATDAVFIIQQDKAQWKTFRDRLGASLTAIRQRGALDTKEEVASTLRDIATGMNQATGFSATRHLDKNARTEKGILDGIDIEQIMRLIELILKLLEAFK